MKHKFLTLTFFILLIFSLKVSGQNYIYRGNKKFLATNTWSFKLNGNYWTGNPEITIAKNPLGGYLMISIEVPFKEHYISGTITVFLSNGTIIKCTNKGIRDHVDNKSIALYNFTKAEIELLKSSRISKIRFSIMCGMQGIETFTANNEKSSYYYDSDFENTNYYETDVEILSLFSK